MIAGMAYSTLKCGAATRDGVAFGVSAEVSRKSTLKAADRSPVILQTGTEKAAPDGADPAPEPLRLGEWGGVVGDDGPHARTRQNRSLEPSAIPF
jgi:hypothetical protein